MSSDMTKPTKMAVRPAKTQISLGICPVWSGSSLSVWKNLGSSATHSAHCEDSDQTWRMPRLIRVFAGCTLILLVLSCCGSNVFLRNNNVGPWQNNSKNTTFIQINTLGTRYFSQAYMWSLPIWRNRPDIAPPFTPSWRGSKNPDIYEFRFFAFSKS